MSIPFTQTLLENIDNCQGWGRFEMQAIKRQVSIVQAFVYYPYLFVRMLQTHIIYY